MKNVFDDIVWGIKHDAFQDSLGRGLIRAWSAGARDAEIEGLIHDQVRDMRFQEELGTLVPFRVPRLRRGKLILGSDVNNQPVSMPIQWLTEGLLLAGNTGSGKSTLLIFLLSQIGQQCPVWISDMYKSQIRHLRSLLPDLIILRPDNWKFNLLEPVTDPRGHLIMATDLLVRTLQLPPRSRVILRQACHDLYRKFGIWEGHNESYPCLFDVYEWVRNTPKLNEASREAILDRLGALLTSLTPKCAAYRRGWNPLELTKFSINFEMRTAPELVKQILLESSLYSLFQHQVERGVVNGPLRLFIAFEDSQRFLNSQQGISGELTPLDELSGILRGTARLVARASPGGIRCPTRRARRQWRGASLDRSRAVFPTGTRRRPALVFRFHRPCE